MTKGILVAAILLVSSLILLAEQARQLNLRGDRFTPLTWEQLTPEQKIMVNDLLAGTRTSLGGPFNALLRSPEMGNLSQKLGEYVRFRSSLPRRLNEMAILMTARWWSSQYEWYAHKTAALEAGLSAAVVDDIQAGRRPSQMQPDERVIYDFCTELRDRRRVSDATFKAAVDLVGEKGVMDLIAVMGYYDLVSMVLNVDRYPLPDGAPLPFLEPAAPASGTAAKGGDDRNGGYEAVADWWKPAPEHDSIWTWGEASGLAVDGPDRIIVAVWGDRNRQNQERPNGTNYLVVVNRNGEIIERWQQWDSILNKPHQVYISPYDPERHVWIVERGGGRDVRMSILKFTNDGKRLVMRLGDGNDPRNRAEARANPRPGPFDYGDPACLAFLPDGSFLLADGYWNSRIIKYNAKGEYLMEWGALGSGPGQFDLVHGVAVDRERRVYVADRTNNRIQLFTENGKFIEEWPDVTDPVGVFIDETDAVWVVSAALNRILKYNRDGVLQYHWGTYGGTRGGFAGGLSRPHQIDVDQEGNVYIASWDGGWVTKYVPKPGADPSRLVGRKLVIRE